MKKTILFSFLFFITTGIQAQQATVSEDKDWKAQEALLKNSVEAEFIIRIGDIDNLNFGWPNGFDPFCGATSESHFYPWDASVEDLPGFDRILLSSKFNPNDPKGCNGDGYTNAFNKESSEPVTYNIELTFLRDAEIKDASLQLFIDDFQAPSMCSKYQVTVNGIRFAEAEKIINAIDQTGPVGKLLTIPLPEEFYNSFHTQDALALKIDEVTGAADGFAIDFIRLLVNRQKENFCKGNIKGKVVDKSTGAPIANAVVFLADKTIVNSDDKGVFAMKEIAAGMEVISASAPGYNDGSTIADIATGNENNEVIISLEKGKAALFDTRQIKVGETIQLKNSLFNTGKAELRIETKAELDKIVAFLKNNANAEIELSGHTSSEGDATLNRLLSYKRVNACKAYIVSKGIDAGRIIASGYGADRPVAPNDTETNRALNRRVEMRISKL